MSENNKPLSILAIEPFYADSHKEWMDGLIQHSKHNIQLISLPGRHWKWRMHGGAVTMAEKVKNKIELPELILCTDMLDLAVFKALLPKSWSEIPIAIYFHENQISYPWSPVDNDISLKRDRHYGFINYTSCLAADYVIFNSVYHRNSFLESLPKFLRAFPDHQNMPTVQYIESKAIVLPVGMDFSNLENHKINEHNAIPIILWNHRWEYDKGPDQFFETLFLIKQENIPFKLVVLGKSYNNSPSIFNKAKKELKEEILHWGYLESKKEYFGWLWKADIMPVSSKQDFFGISVVQAIYADCLPLLPRRLSYQEHLSQDDFFYQSKDEFKSKLISFIQKFGTLPLPDKSKINSYSWPLIIQQYDQLFIDMAK